MTSFLRLTAAVVCLLATPAVAETQSVEVSFADLNLATTAGKVVLERRIKAAIRLVCSDDSRDLYALRAARKCASDARAGAMPQVEIAVARARNPARVALAR